MPRHVYQELNARVPYSTRNLHITFSHSIAEYAKVANCLSSTLTHKQIQFCLEPDL